MTATATPSEGPPPRQQRRRTRCRRGVSEAPSSPAPTREAATSGPRPGPCPPAASGPTPPVNPHGPARGATSTTVRGPSWSVSAAARRGRPPRRGPRPQVTQRGADRSGDGTVHPGPPGHAGSPCGVRGRPRGRTPSAGAGRTRRTRLSSRGGGRRRRTTGRGTTTSPRIPSSTVFE